jgi:hypothetical protein
MTPETAERPFPEIDDRPLTDGQWALMFYGPEWDQATIEALEHSLQKAYEIHAERVRAAAPQSTERELEP